MNGLWRLMVGGALAICAGDAWAATYKVSDQAEYRKVSKSLKPGDEIVLANGEWRDFQILLEGRGEAKRPITLRAETKGRVFITGRSNLRLSGEHLLVSGLAFRDGHSPTDELIAFRRDSKRIASRSRLTEVVVDRFNQPDRRAEDIWVAIYGEDNRVDHSHFEGKTNAGVTLAVIRPRGQPQPNRARIDHNYFGPRPNLGSNGGETIRVGTSEESLSDSNSIVENNYFEHCDGEVEIVSNKSGGNIFRGNVFFESQGALVLRHGSGNLVERNVFFGNGKAHSGGIRVINPRQTVRHNYLERLAGTGFTSAITVMNAVPNSPINRYHQVVGAVIERNTVVEPNRITLAAGADAERSAPPRDTRFDRNLIVSSSTKDPFRAEGDISGINFAGNVQTPVANPLVKEGFIRRPVQMARAANGLLYPSDRSLADAGAARDLKPIARENTGVSWYPKRGPATAAFGTGASVDLAGGAPLGAAVAAARPGDTIRLAPGIHAVSAPIVIDRTVTIAGPGPAQAATLVFSSPYLFRLEQGGGLQLSGLTVSGERAPRRAGNAVVRSAGANHGVFIENSRFVRLDGAADFDVIASEPGSLADRIRIASSRFDGVSGAVVSGRSEHTEQGHYNAEYVDIVGSEFEKVGEVADLLRGGKDESTFGPHFTMTGSRVDETGVARGASVRLSGVQDATISGNRFRRSGPVEVNHSVGSPETVIANNIFDKTPEPRLRELYAAGPPRAVLSANVMGDTK